MPPGPTLDTAGRLGRRERPRVHGEGQGSGGQCSTRSLSATRRSPASVKGGIAHSGGAQVVGWTKRPRKRLPVVGQWGGYAGLWWSAVAARKRRRRGLPIRRSATAGRSF